MWIHKPEVATRILFFPMVLYITPGRHLFCSSTNLLWTCKNWRDSSSLPGRTFIQQQVTMQELKKQQLLTFKCSLSLARCSGRGRSLSRRRCSSSRRFQVLASRRRARHVLEAVVAELGAKLPPLCLGALYGSNHHESCKNFREITSSVTGWARERWGRTGGRRRWWWRGSYHTAGEPLGEQAWWKPWWSVCSVCSLQGVLKLIWAAWSEIPVFWGRNFCLVGGIWIQKFQLSLACILFSHISSFWLQTYWSILQVWNLDPRWSWSNKSSSISNSSG